MLVVAKNLFKQYPNARALSKLECDDHKKEEQVEFWKKNQLRHAQRKMKDILAANSKLISTYDGQIPSDRKALEKLRGVGRHVASVSLAWIHQEPEFGIDVHVKRILKRWNLFPAGKTELQIEEDIKTNLDTKKIGHFSRALVDLGQDVCGYTPECHRCFLRYSCPSANKDLSW
jgi:Predicted EndoIII-related endonuclease